MKPLSEYKVYEEFSYHYEDDNGCYYEDLESFLQCHVLGFCGCGDPPSVLKVIYYLIILKENYRDSNNFLDLKTYHKLKIEYLLENIESVSWFFEYFLDKKGITEHGGNVSGSWICDDNFLEAIKIWHKEYERNNT